MRPLLSREEMHALLDESGDSSGERPRQLVIELGRHRMAWPGELSLDQGTVIEFDPPPNKLYEVRAKDKLVAYGELVVLNGKLVIRITSLVNDGSEEAIA